MFVDANVLVNVRVVSAPDHNSAVARLNRALDGGEIPSVSRQILREYLATLTRPQTWRSALTREEILDDVDRMSRAFQILEDGPAVSEVLVRLCREVPVGGRQIHDANIVATMLAHGERRLLTFNTADFRRFGDRIDLV